MNRFGYNSWTSFVALIAATVISFFMVMPMRIAGLAFVVIRERFGTSRETATIPIVIFGVMRTIMGPFVGYLGEIFGYYEITLIGSILLAVGIGSCYFAESIVAVIIGYGFVSGLGFALSMTMMPTVLKLHYNKNFDFINGMTLAGSCLGAVVMAPVIQYLYKEYGASNMFLILGAILFNSVPASMLLKDPQNEKLEKKQKEKENSLMKCSKENLGFVSDEEKQNYEIKNMLLTIPFEDLHKQKAGEQRQTHSTETVINLTELKSVNRQVDIVTVEKKLDKPASMESKIADQSKSDCETKPLLKTGKKMSHQLRTLFADPAFYCIMLLDCLQAFCCTLNVTVIVDFGVDKGMSLDDSLYFIMFLPVAEIIGSLCFSWIVDKGYISRTNYCAVSFLILGIDSKILVLSVNFNHIMAAVLVFGLISGLTRPTFPGMIYDHIEEEYQNMAIASRGSFYPLMCFAKTPAVGYFRETRGSYNGIFDLITGLCVLCAVFSLLTPYANRLKCKKTVDKLSK